MSDFLKTVIIIVLTVIGGNAITVTTLSANDEHIKIMLDKVEKNQTISDNRIRAVEINQAKLNTLLSHKDVELAKL